MLVSPKGWTGPEGLKSHLDTEPSDVDLAVREGAGQRLRPVVMTATAVIGGLLPILWGHGTGASVMKRIVAPMVGGMVSATVLALLVIPAVWSLWREAALGREAAVAEGTATDAIAPPEGGAGRSPRAGSNLKGGN